ncbi:MAG TPA: phosphatase PAP2 family protein [Bryobacteraceae bacterium]
MTTPTLHRLGVTLCLSVALICNVSAQNISQVSATTGQSSALPAAAPPENRPSETSAKGLCPATFAGDQRPVSWKLLVPNILCDQKRIWIFPWHLVQGNSVLPAAAIAGATAGLVWLDPSTTPYFRRTSSFHSFNQVLSGSNSTLIIGLVPLSFYGLNFLRHDSYGEQTALLAGEAIADAEIVTTVMKDVDRRLRTADIPPNGNFANTWFKSKGTWWRGNGSFPSGHEIAAISVATVFSRRYGRNHKWVPWVAYSMAGLIGFSRLTLSSHFPSDVFLGAALGYSITRYAVLH